MTGHGEKDEEEDHCAAAVASAAGLDPRGSSTGQAAEQLPDPLPSDGRQHRRPLLDAGIAARSCCCEETENIKKHVDMCCT